MFVESVEKPIKVRERGGGSSSKSTFMGGILCQLDER